MDFKAEFEAFAQRAGAGEVSPEAARAILLAETWFTQRQDQLKTILSQPDKGVKFEMEDGDIELAADTELHRGFLLGIHITLEFFGEFPLYVIDDDAADEEGKP